MKKNRLLASVWLMVFFLNLQAKDLLNCISGNRLLMEKVIFKNEKNKV